MADHPTQQSDPGNPDPLGSSSEAQHESNIVCDSWQQMIQGVLGVLMLAGAIAMVHYYAPIAVQGAPPDDLLKQVHELTAEV
jgi:hypothetical protein